MNEVKEIEIDSTFRNRQFFPTQTFFEVPVNSFNDPTNILAAIDPVADAYPQFAFESLTLDPLFSGSATINGVVFSKFSDRIVAIFPNLFQIHNFYRCLSTANLEIVSYKYIGKDAVGSDVGEFNIPKNTFLPGNVITISWTSSQDFSSVGLKRWFIPSFDGQYFRYIFNERTKTGEMIVSTCPLTSTVHFFHADVTWLTTDPFSLRNALPIAFTTTVAPSSGSTVHLPAGFKFYENTFLFSEQYVGKFISVNSFGDATVSPAIDGVLLSNSNIEILPFRENFHSLIYTGSQLSQIENKTYLVQLISLVLPNVCTLKGPKVSSYPYLYVEFLDTNCSSNQNIMSNNPYSNKIYFRVIPSKNQQSQEWLSFDCNGSSKTLRFRPTATNFRFSVKTPNGKFLSLPLDNPTPIPVNPNLQVSLVLNVRILEDPQN
jgi:hypothetical protein